MFLFFVFFFNYRIAFRSLKVHYYYPLFLALVFLAFNILVCKQEMLANLCFSFFAILLTTALNFEP